jgi:hypothetical protein
MVHRVFVLADNDRAALERLGASLILQWSTIPAGIQEALVQQAVALDWATDPEAAAYRIRALVDNNNGGPPTSTPRALSRNGSISYGLNGGRRQSMDSGGIPQEMQ